MPVISTSPLSLPLQHTADSAQSSVEEEGAKLEFRVHSRGSSASSWEEPSAQSGPNQPGAHSHMTLALQAPFTQNAAPQMLPHTVFASVGHSTPPAAVATHDKTNSGWAVGVVAFIHITVAVSPKRYCLSTWVALLLANTRAGQRSCSQLEGSPRHCQPGSVLQLTEQPSTKPPLSQVSAPRTKPSPQVDVSHADPFQPAHTTTHKENCHTHEQGAIDSPSCCSDSQNIQLKVLT